MDSKGREKDGKGEEEREVVGGDGKENESNKKWRKRSEEADCVRRR